jgi:hypothetical protein
LTAQKKRSKFGVGNCVLLTFTRFLSGTLQAPSNPLAHKAGGFSFTEMTMYGKKKKPTPGKYGPKK